MKPQLEEYPWLKNRGYPHLTPQLNLSRDREKILSMLRNEKFIARYAFFPLIHSVIKERRYKSINGVRCHSYIDEYGNPKKNFKIRPLHYASHFDAIIFGYYAELLLAAYEERVKRNYGLSECIIAYRKLPLNGSEKNKSTIHFAHEAFEEIKARANDECEVLKFDIKSFFSRINHSILKSVWSEIIQQPNLPPDHYNVFKAATKFSYIMRDDFRVKQHFKGKKTGFNEKKLAEIRKTGKICLFESPEDFRNNIKSGNIKLHRFPFRDSSGSPVGIPQGLPISAALANIYLLHFDTEVLTELVNKAGMYYRRYSDDIVIICKREQANYAEQFINRIIEESKVEISKEKTERFVFKRLYKNGRYELLPYKIEGLEEKAGIPFGYLGFEFFGDKTLIKSANLSKFYRRMIRAVKTKSRRALKTSQKEPSTPLLIYRRQLYKLYTKYPLSNTSSNSSLKRLIRNDRGEYFYKVVYHAKPNTSNYLTYIHRASGIMHERNLEFQIRNHKKIFNQAISKHFKIALGKL
jgi:hypothetical protein